jgi:hypothetical protein
MALVTLAALEIAILVTFGRSGGQRRSTPLSAADLRRARRLGTWLGLLVPFALAGLAAALSSAEPWFRLTATWSLALVVPGVLLGRLLAPRAVGYSAVPPFVLVLAWAVACGAAVALGSGALAVASGTSAFVLLYALSWTSIVTIAASLPAVFVWVALLVAFQKRTQPATPS